MRRTNFEQNMYLKVFLRKWVQIICFEVCNITYHESTSHRNIALNYFARFCNFDEFRASKHIKCWVNIRVKIASLLCGKRSAP